MKFYEFSQNNSGGSFTVDKKLCHRIFIEADDFETAKSKMEELGADFSGDNDCPCCGNRWSDYPNEINIPYAYGAFEENKAAEFAKKYSSGIQISSNSYGDCSHDVLFNDIKNLTQFLADRYGATTPDSRIYYKNGEVIEVSHA